LTRLFEGYNKQVNKSILISVDHALQLGGARYFERGEDYFQRGLVMQLTERNGDVSALVRGTRDYAVVIRQDNGISAYECSCPVGIRGDFCKHCVATALAWIKEQEPDSLPDPATNMSRRDSQTPDLHAWLLKQTKEKLAGMLLDAAEKDEHIHNRLVLSASIQANPNLTVYKKIMGQAIGRSKFIDYYHMPEYFHRVNNAVDHLDDLLDQGHDISVITLCEWTLTRVERAIERVDDSDGFMSVLLNRLQDIHRSACERARPDPVKLAKRLFNWELNGDWGTFDGAAAAYTDVLGDAGIKSYRELADREWEGIRPLKPGEDDPDRYGKRFRITRIMETLAALSDDLDALVKIKQKDLSSSYRFFDLAQTLLHEQQEDMALEWAEKGHQTFLADSDRRLLELLADLYHRFERHDEAMSIIWARFERRPCLATFQDLKNHADQNNSWPEWRQRAMASLRAASENRDRSELVAIHLWEGDIEAAWSEAQAGGCRSEIWLQLAQFREKTHPEDAVTIYQKQVGPILERTNNQAYKEAMGLVTRIGRILTTNNSEAAFRQYLDLLRSQYKRKRNFIKMLAAIG